MTYSYCAGICTVSTTGAAVTYCAGMVTVSTIGAGAIIIGAIKGAVSATVTGAVVVAAGVTAFFTLRELFFFFFMHIAPSNAQQHKRRSRRPKIQSQAVPLPLSLLLLAPLGKEFRESKELLKERSALLLLLPLFALLADMSPLPEESDEAQLLADEAKLPADEPKLPLASESELPLPLSSSSVLAWTEGNLTGGTAGT